MAHLQQGVSSGATEGLRKIMLDLGGVKNGRGNRNSSEEIFEGIQKKGGSCVRAALPKT